MATLVLTAATTLSGTAFTGTAPGAGNPTVSGTISSSTDWSDHIRQVSFGMAVNLEDFTTFGDGAFMVQKPGIKSADFSVEFNQDYAASSVDATFAAGALAGTLYYFDVKPTSAARAATNPSIVLAAYVSKYPFVGQQVGNRATATVDFAVTGTYARLTA